MTRIIQYCVCSMYTFRLHFGILFKILHDQQAREGSMGSFIGPQPICGVASSALALELKQWKNKTIKQNFSSATGMTISRKFITPNSRGSVTLSRMPLSRIPLSRMDIVPNDIIPKTTLSRIRQCPECDIIPNLELSRIRHFPEQEIHG